MGQRRGLRAADTRVVFHPSWCVCWQKFAAHSFRPTTRRATFCRLMHLALNALMKTKRQHEASCNFLPRRILFRIYPGYSWDRFGVSTEAGCECTSQTADVDESVCTGFSS